MTDSIKSMRARAASHSSWAKTPDRQARTANGTKAFNDRFERQVDPDGVLPREERIRRAASARRAYMIGLAAKSAQTRRASKRYDELKKQQTRRSA